jgi:hypothetical protein
MPAGGSWHIVWAKAGDHTSRAKAASGRSVAVIRSPCPDRQSFAAGKSRFKSLLECRSRPGAFNHDMIEESTYIPHPVDPSMPAAKEGTAPATTQAVLPASAAVAVPPIVCSTVTFHDDKKLVVKETMSEILRLAASLDPFTKRSNAALASSMIWRDRAAA